MANLKLTSEQIKTHLFNGGFIPMDSHHKLAYRDVDEGSLIADIRVGRFKYEVIFSPAKGNVQIFEYDELDVNCWEMDLNTGEYIEW